MDIKLDNNIVHDCWLSSLILRACCVSFVGRLILAPFGDMRRPSLTRRLIVVTAQMSLMTFRAVAVSSPSRVANLTRGG